MSNMANNTLTDNKLINNLLIKNLRILFDGFDTFRPYHILLWRGNPDESCYIGSKRSTLIQNVYIRFAKNEDKVYNIELLARINNSNQILLYSLNGDYIKLHNVRPFKYEFQDMQNFVDSVSDQIIPIKYEFQDVQNFIDSISDQIIPKLKILNIIFNNAFITNAVDDSGHPLDLETLKLEKLTIQKSKVELLDDIMLSGRATL